MIKEMQQAFIFWGVLGAEGKSVLGLRVNWKLPLCESFSVEVCAILTPGDCEDFVRKFV